MVSERRKTKHFNVYDVRRIQKKIVCVENPGNYFGSNSNSTTQRGNRSSLSGQKAKWPAPLIEGVDKNIH